MALLRVGQLLHADIIADWKQDGVGGHETNKEADKISSHSIMLQACVMYRITVHALLQKSTMKLKVIVATCIQLCI